LPVALAVTLLCALLAGCASTGAASLASSAPKDPYVGHDVADLSGYPSMVDHEQDTNLVSTTVAEIAGLMDDHETFAFIAAYADCPYCKTILPYVDEAAKAAQRNVGYLDTRSDPSWRSNLDIDGYDLFVERFGDYLDEDENGLKHLYTPDLYFIRDGSVVANHAGVTPGADDPNAPLTDEQELELRQTLTEEFGLLG